MGKGPVHAKGSRAHRTYREYQDEDNLSWERRFWSRVDKNGPIHPVLGTKCWDWRGQTMVGGYGQFSFNGRTYTAHSLSYQMAKGALTPGQGALHKCDRRKCVNPDHLFAGTAKDNAEDMARKGRAAGQKLTADDVREIIVARRAGIRASVVARMYGVCANTIGDITRGHTWSHIDKTTPE